MDRFIFLPSTANHQCGQINGINVPKVSQFPLPFSVRAVIGYILFQELGGGDMQRTIYKSLPRIRVGLAWFMA